MLMASARAIAVPIERVDRLIFQARHLRIPACPQRDAVNQQLKEGNMSTQKRDERADRCDEFVLAQIGARCWLVACNGHVIAGALLSSLRAATEYAAAVAEGSGRPRFHLRVVPASH